MKFNKLVRDKIPDIIKEQGREYSIRIADKEEFYQKLREKLVEEMEEFLKDDNVEELADVQEVIYALLKEKGVDRQKFEIMRKDKESKKGGFEQKIILEQA